MGTEWVHTGADMQLNNQLMVVVADHPLMHAFSAKTSDALAVSATAVRPTDGPGFSPQFRLGAEWGRAC